MLAKHFLAGLCLFLAGCITERGTSPLRTATEELLISTAADRAAGKLAEQIPANIRAYLDAYIDAPDGIYATRAIRDRLLRRGIVLADDRTAADVIIEVRSGALSTDALKGSTAPFDARLSAARGQPGQIAVSAALRDLLAGSAIGARAVLIVNGCSGSSLLHRP